MRRGLAAFASGLFFAIGLCLAGMTWPGRVLSFLDVFGTWDPSLALVMVGAVSVAAIGFRVAGRRPASLFGGALAAAGFDVTDLPAEGPALREIGLRTPPPGVRLLYGIDPARGRGLVVLGERFDRSFYGDSVRLAEQRWREFLEAGDEKRPSP